MKQEPLSEAELEELDEFLLSLDDLDNSMNLSTLDGFLTAIVSGQRTIPPGAWMRFIWDAEKGGQAPAFENEAQAQRILELVLRHMNGIAGMLLEAPAHYAPLLLENPNDGDPIPIIDEWCFGFCTAMALDDAGWASLPETLREGLDRIHLYGNIREWEKLEQMSLSLEQHRAIADGLAETVRQVHAYFLEQRRQDSMVGHGGSAPREPVKKANRIGRNEPCPCGSGKKYKQCHGST